MITISEQQALERWDSLPASLREALYSENNSDFIWQLSKGENIPDEKIYDVSMVAGYVLMGLLHPEDVAQELIERLEIDKKTATDIQDSLNRRIFTPLRSDIDTMFQPLSKIETRPTSPMIIKDVIAQPKPLSISTNTPTFQSSNGTPSLKSTAIPNNNIVPPTTQANRLSDIGWSRSQSADPVVKLDISQLPKATAPAPISQKPMDAIFSQNTSTSSNPALGEFERLNAMKKGSTMQSSAPAGVPVPPKPPSATPAPFILHEDTGFSAAPKNASFKITQPDSTTADQHLGSTKSQMPVKPAVLEFAGQAANKPVVPPAPPSTSNTVHYSEFQPSLSKMPTDNSGPRQVNQIMPPTNTTPATSIPVPRPPQPPKEKVVVQDFL